MATKPLIIAIIIFSFISLGVFGYALFSSQPDSQTRVLPTLVAFSPTDEPERQEFEPQTQAEMESVDITETSVPTAIELSIDDIAAPPLETEETVIIADDWYLPDFDDLNLDIQNLYEGFEGFDTSISTSMTALSDCAAPVSEGLVLCLESENGVLTGTNNIVTGWEDQSNSENNLLAFGDAQYVLNLTPGGMPGIRFDGFDDALVNFAPEDLPLANADRTIFVVVNYESIGDGGFTYGQTGDCNAAYGLMVSAHGYLTQNLCQNLMANVNINDTGWMVQSVVVVLDSFRHYRDGEMISIGLHQLDTQAGSMVIAASLDQTRFVNMDLATVLVYDRALNESERQQVETYLQFKYLSVPMNSMPLITPLRNQITMMHSPVNIQMMVIDDDVLVFSADGLPEGLSINARTGLISGTITADAGIYPVEITVWDNVNPPMPVFLNWTVVDPSAPPNTPPVASAGDDISVSDNDLNGYEDVTLDAGASTDDKGIISYEWRDALDIVIARTQTTTVTLNTGTTEIFTLTVYDSEGEFSVDSVTVRVNPANDPPVVSPIANQTGTAGSPATLQLIASDTDVLHYHASGLPAGLDINENTGYISGIITAGAGTYPVTVYVNDNMNPAVTVSFNWVVVDAPTPGILSFSLVDTDLNQAIPGYDPIQDGATLDLAQLPANLAIVANTMPYQINGGVHLDVNNGAYLIELDTAPYIYTPGSPSTVMSTGPAFSTGTYSLLASTNFNSLSLTFTVTNQSPDEAPVASAGDDITLTDNDGNGVETVRLDGTASTDDNGIVTYEWRRSGNPTVLASSAVYETTVSIGTHSFDLTVYDAAGTSHTDSVMVTLQAAANEPPALPTINAQTNMQGATVTYQVIAIDTDTLSYGASGLPAGLTIDRVTGLISGTITATPGTYVVTITVADGVNPSVSTNFNWIVTQITQANIVSFTLIDTSTGSPVAGFNPIPAGAVLDLATLPPNLSIVANTSPATVTGGVSFNLDNGLFVYQDTIAPYAAAGDTNGIYTPLALTAGTHMLTASTGTNSLTLTFTVIVAD